MADMHDWRPEIVRLLEVKQAIVDADSEQTWEFHLPGVAATDEDIGVAERSIGAELDLSYRNFLQYANGWPSFYQSVDLFGTDSLDGGPRFDLACSLLDAIEPNIWEQSGLERRSVVPIAATTVDLDVFVMPVANGSMTSPVVWFAGYEIDRFATFDEYVVSMIEYNVRELEDFRQR